MNLVISLVCCLAAGLCGGYFIARTKQSKSDHEVNYVFIRLLVVGLFLTGLIYLLIILKTKEGNNLADSELVKIATGGLVILGILYSILTYEFNVKKRREELRAQKSLTTYSAITAWLNNPLIEYSQEIRNFETGTNYILLKGNMEIFEKFFDNSDQGSLKKSVIAIFNYFETIACGISENIVDEPL